MDQVPVAGLHVGALGGAVVFTLMFGLPACRRMGDAGTEPAGGKTLSAVTAPDALSTALTGLRMGQVIVCVAGVLVVASAYCAAVGVMGVAVGTLLRHTAAVTTVFTVLFVLPGILPQILPQGVCDTVLPSQAGNSMSASTVPEGDLSPGAGAPVVGAWVLVPVAAAAWQLRRRDV